MLTRRYSKYFTNSEVIRCKNTNMVLSRVCATWHFKLPSWSKAVVRFSSSFTVLPDEHTFIYSLHEALLEQPIDNSA